MSWISRLFETVLCGRYPRDRGMGEFYSCCMEHWPRIVDVPIQSLTDQLTSANGTETLILIISLVDAAETSDRGKPVWLDVAVIVTVTLDCWQPIVLVTCVLTVLVTLLFVEPSSIAARQPMRDAELSI